MNLITGLYTGAKWRGFIVVWHDEENPSGQQHNTHITVPITKWMIVNNTKLDPSRFHDPALIMRWISEIEEADGIMSLINPDNKDKI